MRTKHLLSRAAPAACALAFGAGGAIAEVVTLAPSRDNTLYESATGALSNGAGTGMFAGVAGNGLIRRALVAFDTTPIPRGSVVTGATLRMQMSMTHAILAPVALRRALAGWGEAGSLAPQGQGGGGTALPGDATWVHRFLGGAPWASPGGEFEPIASASILVGGFGVYNWSSGGLTDDVQRWVNYPSENFGWLMQGDETFAPSAKRFDTREHPDPLVRPSLTINYLAPCPGDADRNRVVDFGDLNIVLSEFGSSAVGLRGDLDYNGRVDFADLNIVLSAFGSAC